MKKDLFYWGNIVFWGSEILWVIAIVLSIAFSLIPYWIVWVLLGGVWIGLFMKMAGRKEHARTQAIQHFQNLAKTDEKVQ